MVAMPAMVNDPNIAITSAQTGTLLAVGTAGSTVCASLASWVRVKSSSALTVSAHRTRLCLLRVAMEPEPLHLSRRPAQFHSCVTSQPGTA